MTSNLTANQLVFSNHVWRHMFFVHWNSGAPRGEIDHLPSEWFHPSFMAAAQLHRITSASGKGQYQAKCDVKVQGNAILLDYGGTNASFNKKRGVDTGVSRVTFKSGRLTKIVKYEWSENRVDFEDSDVTIASSQSELFEIVNLLEEAEGNRVLAFHYRRERARGLAARKIRQVKANGSDIKCEACGFSFKERFGQIGIDFCEVHHRNPLANGPRITSLDELALLCANCHRMIHRVISRENSSITLEKFAVEYLQ